MEESDGGSSLLNVIHEGRAKYHDLVVRGLQLATKKKGGLVASYCQAGQADGMKLTRAAFAVMIKFQGLMDTFQEMVEDMEAAEHFSIPSEEGPAKESALEQIVNEFSKSDQILSCWQNATKMRRWFITKKQSISEKLEYADDKEAKENETLKAIIDKVVKKAEFLSILSTPNAAFMADEEEK